MKRKSLYIILSIIIISLLSLTIAYAALSATLNITGSAHVNASTWDIKIRKSGLSNKVTGTASYTTPTITDSKIANYSVTLAKPGDSVTLYFDIKNNSSFNAEISSLINSTPTCTSQTGNSADEKLVCDNLEINLSYYKDKSLSIGDIVNTKSGYCFKDEVAVNDLDTILQLKIQLKESMTNVSSSNITISNLSHEIIYIPTEKECHSPLDIA